MTEPKENTTARWPLGRRRRFAAPLGALFLAGLGACYPGATDPEDSDVILTLFDTDHDFSSVATYFMPDSVVREPGAGEPEDGDDTVRAFDEAILEEVEAQFAALGYRRIEEPLEGAPDGVVLVSVSTTDRSVWEPGCWYCGWDWYPWGPDWGWSWGPGYAPGYPDGSGVGIRTDGTLVVTLLDPITPGTELQVWWVGSANGLLSSDSGADLARVQRSIGQMFVQSPYLGEGGVG